MNKPAECPLAPIGKVLHYTYESRCLIYITARGMPVYRMKSINAKVLRHRYDGMFYRECRAYNALSCVCLEKGFTISPEVCDNVDCGKCPVLAENPCNKESSPTHDEVMADLDVYKNPELAKYLKERIKELDDYGVMEIVLYFDLFNKNRPNTSRRKNKKAFRIAERENERLNKLRGRKNGYSTARGFLGMMLREDYFQELKEYHASQSEDNPFCQGIEQAIYDVFRFCGLRTRIGSVIC